MRNEIDTKFRTKLRRAGVMLALVAAIGGGALLTGCGGGGDGKSTISQHDIEVAKEKIENGEGPSQEQLEEAAAAVKKQFEEGEGPGQAEIEEISKKGKELVEEATAELEESTSE
jgi:hypothetical protein